MAETTTTTCPACGGPVDIHKRERSVIQMAKFSRWVSIGGECDDSKFGQTFALAQVARSHGMEIIVGCKPSMHLWHEFGLSGTSEQMKATESEWREKRHEVCKRKPSGAFGVNLDRPKKKWVELEMSKRLAHGCYGGPCQECDKGAAT